MNLKYLSYSSNRALSDIQDNASTIVSVVEELHEFLEQRDETILQLEYKVEQLENELMEARNHE